MIFLKCLQKKLFFKLSDKILDIFPIVNKVFGLSFFKKGIIYRDIGMRDKAQKVFQTLVNFYPDSEYRAFAEQEIHNI